VLALAKEVSRLVNGLIRSLKKTESSRLETRNEKLETRPETSR
jgi:hypothetical protein